MDPKIIKEIVHVNGDTYEKKQDEVVVEFPLTIVINGDKYVTLVATPVYLDELAVGYIYSEGLIKTRNDINFIKIQNGIAEFQLNKTVVKTDSHKDKIVTSGCGKSIVYTDLNGSDLTKNDTYFCLSRQDVMEMINILFRRSELFRETGGVHNALLVDLKTGSNVFREDIGRHNAVDKLLGYMILNEISPEKTAIVTSGRVSAEILVKVARANIPVLISRSAPTDLAIKLADNLGITLIGFARGKKFNIYSNMQRICDI